MAQGLTTKGHKFGGTVLCFDHGGDGYTTVYICQISYNCTVKRMTLVYKLYFNKPDLRKISSSDLRKMIDSVYVYIVLEQ